MAGGAEEKAMEAMDLSKFYPVITFLLATIALTVTVFIPGGFLAGAGTIYILLPLKFFISEYLFPNTPAGKMLGAGKSKSGAEDSGGEDDEAENGGGYFDLRSAAEKNARIRESFAHRNVSTSGKPTGQAAATAGKAAKSALGKAGWLAVVDYFITPMKDSEKAVLMFSTILYVIAFCMHITLLVYIAYSVCKTIPVVPESWCAAAIDYFAK